jgi:hypothetical protein
MMSASGEQLTQHILDELSCPHCDYLLRGLPGPIVRCPECGTECSLPQMIARHWIGTWHRAPLYPQLLAPVTVATISPFPLLLMLAIETEAYHGSGVATVTAALGVVVAWVCLLERSRRLFGNDRGLGYALVAHGLLLGYIVAVAGIIAAISWAIRYHDAVWIGLSMCLAAGMIGILIACRRGERFIAEQCIKQYLQRTTPAPSVKA